MNHKVITIALIVFALIFIVLLAVMMGTITEKTNTANAQLVDTLSMADGADLNTLDGTSVRGNMVVSTIKNGKSDTGSEKMFYVVTTGDADKQTTVYYGYGESGGSVNVFDKNRTAYSYTEAVTAYSPVADFTPYSVTDTSDDEYINEKTAFEAHVLFTQNGVPVGVHYIQEGINQEGID